MIRLIALLPLLLVQDSPEAIYDYLGKTKDEELALKAQIRVRRVINELDESSKLDPIWTAVYIIIRRGAGDPVWIKKHAKKAASHLKSINFGNHAGITPEQHLEFAIKLKAKKDGPMRVLALAHLDAAASIDRSAALKALKLVKAPEFRVADPGTADLLAFKKDLAESAEAIVARKERYKKSKSFETQYARIHAFLRSVPNDLSLTRHLFGALDSAKSGAGEWASRHLEAIEAGLAVYLRCDACKGKRTAVCNGCLGKGQREYPCHYCKGEGGFRSTEGTTQTFRACPACLNKAPTRTDKCNFCDGKGKVTCERCRYLKPKYKDLVTEKDCHRCKGAGLLFHKAAYACPLCRGLGMILKPTADPEATVAPQE